MDSITRLFWRSVSVNVSVSSAKNCERVIPNANYVTGLGVPAGETVDAFCYALCYGEDLDIWGNGVDEISFLPAVNFVDEDGKLLAVDLPEYETMPRYGTLYSIYPTGKDAGSVKYPEPKSLQGEQLVEDNEYIKLIFRENTLNEEYGDSSIEYYLENKMEKDISVSLVNLKVNGTEINPGREQKGLAEVPAGKRVINTFSFTKYDEGYKAGEKIEEITFTLEVKDMTVNGSGERPTVYTADCTVIYE